MSVANLVLKRIVIGVFNSAVGREVYTCLDEGLAGWVHTCNLHRHTHKQACVCLHTYAICRCTHTCTCTCTYTQT